MAKKKPSTKSTPPTSGNIEIIARACLLHGSTVLLCKNLKHSYLYLPGGHVEFSESAAQALQRELIEECGLKVKVGPLALVSEGTFKTAKKTHHELNLVFHVEHPPSFKPSRVRSREKHIGFEWMELAAVPDADIRPLATKAWLATLGQANPGQIDWVSEIK